MTELSAKQNKVVIDAINTYGQVPQMDMIVEECSELIQAIQKYKRNPCEDNRKAIVDELADVSIMCKSGDNMFSRYGDEIKERIEFKIDRLQDRLEVSKALNDGAE